MLCSDEELFPQKTITPCFPVEETLRQHVPARYLPAVALSPTHPRRLQQRRTHGPLKLGGASRGQPASNRAVRHTSNRS